VTIMPTNQQNSDCRAKQRMVCRDSMVRVSIVYPQ
jgi:hypothetical protein